MNNRRRLRNNGERPKAFWGAIIGAGIGAIGSLVGSAIQSNSAVNSAEAQANATLRAAQQNADALAKQNENNNRLQRENIEFTKSENEKNRQLQRDTQMTLQMMAGKESSRDRRIASKLQVRNGGVRANKFSLRGGNIPFIVTDGGGVIPVGITPEGYNLYEIAGNDHKHYHKTRGGKAKTGVGIKFANGEVVEGEGNQNSNNGELLMTTPDGAYFISKHTLDGFNPAKAVKDGMSPVEAFNIQENIKDMNNITDDGRPVGRNGKCVRRRLRTAGGQTVLFIDKLPQGIDFDTDTINPSGVGIAYQENINNKAKNGKRVRCLRNGGRQKADTGTFVIKQYPYDVWMPDYVVGSTSVTDAPSVANVNPITQAKVNRANSTLTGTYKPYNGSSNDSSGFSGWMNKNADYVGAGIGALGNIGGALISTSGANKAAGILSDAYLQSSNILADAYRNMRGIDLSDIRREDYSAAHVMPAIRSAQYNINPELALEERRRNRLVNSVKRNSLSSAAMLNRLGKIEVDSADVRNKLYAEQANQEEKIKQANMEAINKAAMINAQLDAEASQQWADDYMKAKMYNADIENAKITQSAGALSNGLNLAAAARANALSTGANAWSSALTGSTMGFGNVLAARSKQRADINNVMLGATTDAQINHIASNGTRREKQDRLDAVQAALDNGNLSPEDKARYEYYKTLLIKSL